MRPLTSCACRLALAARRRRSWAAADTVTLTVGAIETWRARSAKCNVLRVVSMAPAALVARITSWHHIILLHIRAHVAYVHIMLNRWLCMLYHHQAHV